MLVEQLLPGIEIAEASSLTHEHTDRIRELADAAAREDGVPPLGEQPLLSLSRPHPGVSHFLLYDDDVLVGYAQTTDTDDASTAEIAVAPGHRGKGIASALVSYLLRRHSVLQFWAHGDLPGAREIAESHGLQKVRELLYMVRTSDSAPAVSVDPGRSDVEVVDLVSAYRRFGHDEVDSAILRVNNAAFSWHPEQGGWTLEQLRERMAVSWFDPQGFFLALAPGDPLRLVGFHWTKVHPAERDAPAKGEVYVVGVDPRNQGHGLGKMLTAVGVAHLEARGLDEVGLYVEGDNTAAVRAYEALGFRREKVDAMYGNGQV